MSKMTEMLFNSIDKYSDFLTQQPSLQDRVNVKKLGHQVLEMRKKLGYSRSELVELIDIDLVIYTSIECGIGDLETAKLIHKKTEQLSTS